MKTHRLGRTEIFRMRKDGDAGGLAVEETAHMNPIAARFISFHAVCFAVGGEEGTIFLTVPCPVSADAQTAIIIFWEDERRTARAGLRGNQIECEIIRAGQMVSGQSPCLSQNRSWGAAGKIDEKMLSEQTGMNNSGPLITKMSELHLSFLFAHVPKVGLATFETGFGPGKPDAVMMDVVGGIVVRDLFSGGAENRMNVTAAFELGFDVRPGQVRFSALINKNLFSPGGKCDAPVIKIGIRELLRGPIGWI